MARGKVKYKDLVKGGGKRSGGGKKSSKKNAKKPQRKTYSLYKNDGNKNDRKRKFAHHPNANHHHNQQDEESKRAKVDEKPKIDYKEQDSSSSESDEDHMKQLRETFSDKGLVKSLAIDSDSEESTDDEAEGTIPPTEDQGIKSETDEDDVGDENEIELTLEPQVEDNSYESALDPFARHVFYDLHPSVLNSLQSVPIVAKTSTLNWPKLGKLVVQIPLCDQIDPTLPTSTPGVTLAEEAKFAPSGKEPENNPKQELFIKSQIADNLKNANPALGGNDTLFTHLQSELFSVINNYQDLYYPGRSFDNSEEIRFVYCLHAVNHILKTRMKVIHHNSRLSNKDQVPEEFRDQGLVRPKILVIVPFKSSAHKIVEMLIKILIPDDKGNIMNKKRFTDEYTGNEISLPKKNPKPEDYEQTFSGNTSDDFKMGITVTKKSLKLFADFYSSDIIIASPLGLRTIIGAVGEPDRNFDFLASIELLVLDQTEIFLMQNWDHLMHIFDHMHLQPKESHGTDFARVRTWSLNGWSKYYRQTLIFSSVVLPEINGIFNKRCHNFGGKVKVATNVEFGSISQVVVQLPHVFRRFEASSVADVIDARFDFFVEKILAQQNDTLMKQTLIYVANYFDYVRLRNYFKKEEISFVQICEYSKEGKIARARDMFYHGDAHFLLYTERYHFFNRIRVKGIRHLVFYQPPTFPHFYYEMCNLMQETNMNRKIGNMSNMTVTVLHSKYDVHQLAAIVGTERAAKMSQSDRNVHMMVTGGD